MVWIKWNDGSPTQMTDTPTWNLEKKVEEAGGVEGRKKQAWFLVLKTFMADSPNKRNPPLIKSGNVINHKN